VNRNFNLIGVSLTMPENVLRDIQPDYPDLFHGSPPGSKVAEYPATSVESRPQHHERTRSVPLATNLSYVINPCLEDKLAGAIKLPERQPGIGCARPKLSNG
jgi:hypothetical protein